LESTPLISCPPRSSPPQSRCSLVLDCTGLPHARHVVRACVRACMRACRPFRLWPGPSGEPYLALFHSLRSASTSAVPDGNTPRPDGFVFENEASELPDTAPCLSCRHSRLGECRSQQLPPVRLSSQNHWCLLLSRARRCGRLSFVVQDGETTMMWRQSECVVPYGTAHNLAAGPWRRVPFQASSLRSAALLWLCHIG